jgi:solute carrier family 25, member 39/40
VRQVGIYFPLYDALAAELAKGPAGAQAPLVAGAVARTAAVLCTSPLELVRTRMQVRWARQQPAALSIKEARLR